MKQIFFLIITIVTVLGSSIAYGAHAQGQLATQIAQKTWVIDANTAIKGITLASEDGALKVAVPSGQVSPGTSIELTTFASEYFYKISGDRRITPLYRITVVSSAGASTQISLPVLIRYPAQELGKKAVRLWGEDDTWQEIKSRNNFEKNVISVAVGAGASYIAAFTSDTVLETGFASWYKYKNCDCAASPDYPKGTILKVTNLQNGKSVKVKVNDFGPDRSKHPDRVIDLDHKAFTQLAGPKKGLVKVRVEPAI